MTDIATLTVAEARRLEGAFLAGLNDAQDAYERIVRTGAWTALGFDTFAEWWEARVRPAMRALSMRPTREIAAAVVEQVRQEESNLPPAQRRTQRELAEMVGVERSALANRDGSRSLHRETSHGSDLEDERIETPAPFPGPETEAAGTSTPAASVHNPQPAPRAANPEDQWTDDERDLVKRLRDGETVVVSMRSHGNLIAWAESADLYERVDRRTQWGNPFEMPADGDRAAVIANYQWYYLPHKPSLSAKVHTLKGKALGCWCAPEECHADVLAELAEGGELR